MYGNSFDASAMDSFAHQYERAGNGFPIMGASYTASTPARSVPRYSTARDIPEDRLRALESGYQDLQAHLGNLQDTIAASFADLKNAVLGQDSGVTSQPPSRLQTTQESAVIDRLQSEIRDLQTHTASQQDELKALKVFRHDAWEEDAPQRSNYKPHRYHTGAMQGSPPRGSRPSSRAVSRRRSAAPSANMSTASSFAQSTAGTARPESNIDYSNVLRECPPEVLNVLGRFEDAIDALYHFYCYAVQPTKATSGMSLADLSKLIRDCELVRSGRITIATVELIHRECVQTSTDGSDSRNGNGTAASRRSSVSRRRSAVAGANARQAKSAPEIDRATFGLALIKLAHVVYLHSVEWSSAKKLENLLLKDILPHAKRRDPAQTACPDLDLPEIRRMFTQHRKELVNIFKYWSRKGHTARTTVSQVRFLEFCKYYGILPFIEKGEIRELYRHIARTPPASSHPGQRVDPDAAPELSYTEFCHLLGSLGLRIYSSELYSETYPTPESRVRKLLVKILVLTKPKQVDIRGNTT